MRRRRRRRKGKMRRRGIATIVMIIMKIIIVLTMMAPKCVTLDLLRSYHSASICLQHARSQDLGTSARKSRATHRALIVCNSVA